MHIVIPGALPAPPYAAELARRLPEHAPCWTRLLAQCRARLESFDVAQRLCTPYEAWQLQQAGYQGEPPGMGLGPLLARADNIEAPVWVADFVHLALGTDHASLVPADALELTAEDSQTLLDAIQPVLDDHGFTACWIDAKRIRLTLPQGLTPASASPNAVAGHPLRTWWQTDAASRPWRRVLNEIQMVWHAHEVNERRIAAGQLPINALWLYGGGRGASLGSPAAADGEVVLRTDLLAAARDSDWNAWLQACTTLDQAVFRPLLDTNGTLARGATDLRLTLMGDARLAHLSCAARPVWLRWWPHTKENWTHWWSLPA